MGVALPKEGTEPSPLRPLLYVLGFVAAVSFAACSDPQGAERDEGLPGARPGPDTAPRPDVVLIAIDGFHYRDIAAFGGAPAPTPAFDRLAREAVLYTDAYAPSPWAGESLAALLSGERIRSDPSDADPGEDRIPTLAEYLGHLGYRTALACGHVRHLDAAAGPPRGFDTVLDVEGSDTTEGARASSVKAAALEWLTDRPGPSFLVCTFADPRPPHHLYEGQVPGADVPYEGPVASGMSHSELLRRAPRFSADDRARLAELHASEVAMCERAFDTIAGAAEARRAPPPILILAGLRAPALGSYGVDETGTSRRHYGLVPALDPNALAVPLLVRFSGAPGGAVDAPVSLVDLTPTLLDALGFEPRLDIEGRSVFPGARILERALFSATARGVRGALALRDGRAVRVLGRGDDAVLQGWTQRSAGAWEPDLDSGSPPSSLVDAAMRALSTL